MAIYRCIAYHQEDMTEAVLEAACGRESWTPPVDDITLRESGVAVPVEPSGTIRVGVTCSQGHRSVFEVDSRECIRRPFDRGARPVPAMTDVVIGIAVEPGEMPEGREPR